VGGNGASVITMELSLDQRDVVRATVRRKQADLSYGGVQIYNNAVREVGVDEPSGAWRADTKDRNGLARAAIAGLNPSTTSDSSQRANVRHAHVMILGDQTGCLLRGVFAVGEDG
jgi:hypothetical protein